MRATYRYQKEDVDELSFEAGEIVRVVEYDDPEEQVNRIQVAESPEKPKHFIHITKLSEK